MNKNTKKRLDPYEIVEERLEEFEKRISKIEEKMSEIEDKTRKSFDKYVKYVKSLSKILALDVVIQERANELDNRNSGDTSLFDSLIKRIQEKRIEEKEVEDLGLFISRLEIKSQIGNVIRIASNWDIPFEDIASYLIHSLGKEEAKILVGKEDLIEYYGKEILPIWESLLKE